MSYQPPAGPPPDSKTQYSAPSGAPPSQQQFTAPAGPPPAQGLFEKRVTTLIPLGKDEYKPLLPFTYLTLNRIQAPELYNDYMRSIGKKRKALFGGNKKDKELAKDYDTKLVYKDASLKRFYTTDDDILNTFMQDQCMPRIKRLAKRFNMENKDYLFYDLCQICLFDVFFYIDNSGSMNAGNRLKQLYDFLILFMQVNVSSQPLKIRIMNNHANIAQLLLSQFNIDLNNITTEEQLQIVFNNMSISGVTPLATQLYELILKPEVIDKPMLTKPVLVVMFTDGAPTRDKYKLGEVIYKVQTKLKRMQLPKKSVCYQIAQIGDDSSASDYLESLDNDSTIGDVVDCTSPIEKEMNQMARKNKELSTEVNYVKKLLLGAIDMSYDSMDEVNHKVY
ncbi:hypothetical protein CANARDRAFT_7588 [[Candida] arabinofermentans NRRL YB-2248]|uniref:VWFA domain-containing protein n=1 Tax=[Candida] arabinofermentans NRRL YB-2248 TaxID=983967 RepID=A0A1E4T132_9ASCO|nr:hypothetical protein CANARDRAFT_7588 [[Candida] arabinofermentans NRRL YB-2248]